MTRYSRQHIQVIADNGDGLVLQAKHWRHSYESSSVEAAASQLAADLVALTPGVHPDRDWDGNEAREWPAIQYDKDEERNGGYRWFAGPVHRVIRGIMAAPAWGRNLTALQDALRQLGG